MKNAIALLGQPNSGKSTVYNALTGSRQHVGNWPGKTGEKNDGFYTYNGTRYTVTDLPGSYGLSGNSDEEIITADFIKADQADRESHSLKWTARIAAFYVCGALILACIVYHIAALFL